MNRKYQPLTAYLYLFLEVYPVFKQSVPYVFLCFLFMNCWEFSTLECFFFLVFTFFFSKFSFCFMCCQCFRKPFSVFSLLPAFSSAFYIHGFYFFFRLWVLVFFFSKVFSMFTKRLHVFPSVLVVVECFLHVAFRLWMVLEKLLSFSQPFFKVNVPWWLYTFSFNCFLEWLPLFPLFSFMCFWAFSKKCCPCL